MQHMIRVGNVFSHSGGPSGQFASKRAYAQRKKSHGVTGKVHYPVVFTAMKKMPNGHFSQQRVAFLAKAKPMHLRKKKSTAKVLKGVAHLPAAVASRAYLAHLGLAKRKTRGKNKGAFA